MCCWFLVYFQRSNQLRRFTTNSLECPCHSFCAPLLVQKVMSYKNNKAILNKNPIVNCVSRRELNATACKLFYLFGWNVKVCWRPSQQSLRLKLNDGVLIFWQTNDLLQWKRTRVQEVRLVLWAARLVERIWSTLSEKCVHVLPYIGLHNTSSAYNWSILDKSLILRLTAIVFWPQQLVATTLIWRNMAPHFLRVHANVRIYIYIAIS